MTTTDINIYIKLFIFVFQAKSIKAMHSAICRKFKKKKSVLPNHRLSTANNTNQKQITRCQVWKRRPHTGTVFSAPPPPPFSLELPSRIHAHSHLPWEVSPAIYRMGKDRFTTLSRMLSKCVPHGRCFAK